ncbi:hypothetical protein POL67_34870 [Polyangium sp. rjm3]|uniref:Uncharacterized protein n=1 Tax=Polyangium mundeleinium TaxID=2995306 RepID=A0ABT5EXN4_9BACT|nr:hypothetical protein [Polyangium mundeleinium]MDC0746563.1 hypothetical protein [Polyangium mundeleinium]
MGRKHDQARAMMHGNPGQLRMPCPRGELGLDLDAELPQVIRLAAQMPAGRLVEGVVFFGEGELGAELIDDVDEVQLVAEQQRECCGSLVCLIILGRQRGTAND